MIQLFATSWFLLARAFLRAMLGRESGIARPWRRRLVLLALLPAFVALQAANQTCLLLDELLFRRFRRVDIREPLFVVGAPRTGTTQLHRALAEDPFTTTLRTYECLFAPSILQRGILGALLTLDRAIGRPGGRLFHLVEQRLAAGFDSIHETRLDAPEEDYLALLPAMGCFLAVLAFPDEEALWKLGRLDDDGEPLRRRRLLELYRGLVQRHLWVHGPGLRFLAKNPSFSGWVVGLAEVFPDARFLCCTRDPLETVPSQLSSVAGGLDFFGVDPRGPFRDRLVAQLEYDFDHLLDRLPDAAPGRHAFVPLEATRRDLAGTVSTALDRVGLPVSRELTSYLARQGEHAKSYRSGHDYTFDSLKLDEIDVRRRFRSIHQRLENLHGKPASGSPSLPTKPSPA